jgi:hypothetical protein
MKTTASTRFHLCVNMFPHSHSLNLPSVKCQLDAFVMSATCMRKAAAAQCRMVGWRMIASKYTKKNKKHCGSSCAQTMKNRRWGRGRKEGGTLLVSQWFPTERKTLSAQCLKKCMTPWSFAPVPQHVAYGHYITVVHSLLSSA